MRNDNVTYYRRQKRSIALRSIMILLILFAAAAVYLLIDRHIAAKTMENLVNEDYSNQILSFEKAGESSKAGYTLTQRQDETLGTYEYVTPLGFSIVSRSEKWTGEKLKEVYKELLNNKHSDEIMYISKIIIYPGKTDNGLDDSDIAGTHSQEKSEYHVFFDLPALAPQSMEYVMKSDLSVIELYNMDAYDDISQAARTISHEYGHHYTMYYFLANDTEAKASDYYTLRGFDKYDKDVFFNTVDEYYKNHEWSIYEIAAEDYVQLMGSSTGKKTQEYLDVYDLVTNYGSDDYTYSYNDTIVNVFPQENTYIPLADDIGGLRNYYDSFIGAKDDLKPIDSEDFNLEIRQKSHLGRIYYEITWNKISNDPDALYTVVCYDKSYNFFSAVRTVYGDEKQIARIGKYVVLDGNQEKWWPSEVTEDDRYFKVFLLLPDGRMISSKPLYMDF